MAGPPIPAEPLADSVVIQQFAGLRNTVTAERLGPGDFETAVNIDLDDAGQVHRRRGFTLVSAGNYHSVFTTRRAIYGVKNTALGIINPDYTFTEIQAAVGSEALAYVQVEDNVYFSSPTASGVISADGVVGAWGAVVDAGQWISPVVNPTSTLGAIRGRQLGAPPMATALAYLNGRIYLAHRRTVWATELYLYALVDKTRNFLQFESDITVLGSASDGLYVGTQDAVWFLSGTFREMRRVQVSQYGALPGSLVYVPAGMFSPETAPSGESPDAVLFMTNSGLVVGLDSGVTRNLTQDRILFPDAQSVAALFRRQDGVNQYIGVVDSGGAPQTAARIGDYVDAEIRRFQGA